MKKLLLFALLQSAIMVAAQNRAEHLFYEDFSTDANFYLNWEVLDKNNDQKTWERNVDAASDADGGVGYAKYTYHSKNAADDYLTTRNSIALKAGTNCLSFQYRTSTTRNKETFDVLYGTSPDVSTMTVLKSFPSYSKNTWDTSVNDFTIEEDGNYYFSFHVTSAANQAGLWLDNIAVDAGSYQGNPDITLENLILPASDCSLGVAPIKVTVKNIGTAVINGFSLYYEIDGANKVTQTFADEIDLGGSLDVQFTTPVDFSRIDELFNVAVVANCDNQVVFNNDTIRGRVVNLTSTTVPFESNFKNAIEVLNWNPLATDGWAWKSANNSYKANTPSTLLSRCIDLEPGDYRVTFDYNAGDELIIGGKKYDYFYISFGKSGSQPAAWQKIKEFKAHTDNTIVREDVQFTVTEAGNYNVSFTSTELAYLEIHNIVVSKIAEHDVKVESIINKVKIPATVPQYHINTTHEFEVSVVNNGKHVENNVVLNIKGNNGILSTTTIPTLAMGLAEKKTVNFNITLAGVKSNKEQPFSIIAEAYIPNDDSPEDNVAEILTMVSDSTYIWDNPANFEFGVGSNSAPVAFGTTFNILKEDVLTSITLGFMNKPAQSNDQITLSVYKIGSDSNMGTPLLSKTVSRGEGGKEVTFKVPELNLLPGKYMFEVKQEGTTNMGLVTDRSDKGLIAVSKNNFMSELPGYGFACIRPNFSKNYITSIQNQTTLGTEVSLYPNPATEAVHIKTNGSRIQKIAIHNLLGQTVLSAIGNGTENQALDINSLAPGTYLVFIQTDTKVETVKLIVK